MTALGLGVQHDKSHAKRRSKLARPKGVRACIVVACRLLVAFSDSFFPLIDLLLEPRSHGYS